MAELVMHMNCNHSIQVGDTTFEIESIYGNEPLEELLAEYICEKIRENQDVNEAAA